MPPNLKIFLQRWAINTLAVLLAGYLVEGIRFQKPVDLLVASLLLGILNAILRPLLVVLSLPLVVFTLGLFTLVINALVLYFVGALLYPHFYVETFGAAFWGALVVSLVSLVLNSLTSSGASRISFYRSKPPPGRNDDDDHPVIDV